MVPDPTTADARSRPVMRDRSATFTGIVASVVLVGITTAAIYPVKTAMDPIAAVVLYLLAVLIVASFWGARFGFLTAILSGLAFNWFHIPPTGKLTIASGQDGGAYVAFLVVAAAVSVIADRSRTRAIEAEMRRHEADFGAEAARLLLGGRSVEDSLPTVTHRLAQVLELPSAAIELRADGGDDRKRAFALNDAGTQIGTLLLPSEISNSVAERVLTRIVPALETLLAAAIHREALQAGVVESQALRRSDEVKTALLRAVSHDLRSPLTAISTAGEALGSPNLTTSDREQLSAAVTEEAARLSTLVDQLLDLSRLQAGAAVPHQDWCSVEEILREALAQLSTQLKTQLNTTEGKVTVSFDSDIPLVRADAAQLERAFANLLGNSLRYSLDEPVSVQGHRSTAGVVIRVSNSGPGIPHAELERIFEPFYRGEATGHAGSGLGLAIVKGFVEANGGNVRAESLPGQGATFVVELPLEAAPTELPAASRGEN